ncbi:UvrB/UvrC motif-containing protein [Phycisphaerales bacterium ac7]
MPKCDMCDNEATVHEVIVRNGQRIERHLCEDHAKEAGVFTSQSFSAAGQVVKKVVMSQSGLAEQAQSSRSSCPECGLSFAEFRQDGLLGCAKCYQAFADKLVSLLRRAHDGGDHHVGKVPKRAGTCFAKQERLTALRKQLKECVDLEQYEKAASIRDEIAEIESAPAERLHRSDSGEPAPSHRSSEEGEGD